MELGEDQNRGVIMVVDDTPANLKLLDDMLTGCGYRVLSFPSGDLALKALEKNLPDLILLDIDMPVMNGCEVCSRLKAAPPLQQIPVLFISALSDVSDKVKAFAAGGLDYVTKPFQFEEVRARIETHLRVRRQQVALQETLSRLKELESLRDNLVHMVIHDMRNPLSTISGAIELLRPLDCSGELKDPTLDMAQSATNELTRMVNALLDISRLESGKMPLHLQTTSLRAIAQEAIRDTSMQAKWENVVVHLVEDLSDAGEACVDPVIIQRVLCNLIGNAIKFSPENGRIEVCIRTEEKTVSASVRDHGRGIPERYHRLIFEKFGQVATREEGVKYSSGLGLTFCKLAIEAHDGTIGLQSEPGVGSEFFFTVPRFLQPVESSGD
ncbi:MAG: hybrid sensor histidine kinase/response regulator [Verrucomicrobiota bacterium]|nr:hybrid sensor histidine kinase/response regulator [Verrucomicrobiota bacterium]